MSYRVNSLRALDSAIIGGPRPSSSTTRAFVHPLCYLPTTRWRHDNQHCSVLLQPMARDPHNPFDEKAVGLAALGAVFFFAVTGLGIGAFLGVPAAGGVAGAALGIVAAVALVPPLVRDWP